MANNFIHNLGGTSGRDDAEKVIEALRKQGGMFVEAVRVTRMPMAVTAADLPGNPIVFANKAFESLCGYSLPEIMGQSTHFLVATNHDEAAAQQFALALSQGGEETHELTLYRKDGQAFRSSVFISPLYDDEGVLRHHFISYLDITRRYELERTTANLANELASKVSERTAELEEANKHLRQLLIERHNLVVEINHRAKNSLAIASSILGIKAGRSSDDTVRAVLTNAQQRIQSMAHVHDVLSKTMDQQRVHLSDYLSEVCDQLKAAFPTADRVELQLDLDESIMLRSPAALPVGLIVVELVINAFKHAFPDGRSGAISLSATRHQRERVTIVVQDDGVGITDHGGRSIGTGIMQALVRQVGGELRIASVNGVRAEFSFDATE